MTEIGFIGAGRLGTAFGLYLARREEHVSGYYSRTYRHAQIAAESVGRGCRPFRILDELLKSSDWIAITTSDGAIGEVSAAIANSSIPIEEKVIFHMSGARASDILAPLAEKGALVASLHPLQTFAGGTSGCRAMERAMFSIEGDARAVKQLGDWLDRIGQAHFTLAACQKPLYHAAASIASNALTGVIGYAVELMKTTGIEERKALSALFPLIETTVQNVIEKGAAQALTGPVVRGDTGTVETHLKALMETAPNLVPFYKTLGKITLATAAREQLKDERAIERLNDLFE
ncbi:MULTISPECIES: Rossmann-like and DUF2520 domain-containing protein [Aneurinibacillus]|jgi:predicted short-subunit dehydrogenase-like oxidoreductase (DUF2520 family)|uniref:NADP oxidoreductase n=1 Tax=Aneurinibacillus danicus TaxID=267746 RepID=A0A511VCF3_9BACL|nr:MULTISPECIES: DUF2520 domain-containing protein [Aneurinibacillus]GEN36529.1 NADP oxidoreductase [Aneurinibacillus danicus]